MQFQQPILCPSKENCYFYHSITYPDGDVVNGTWDIRGNFSGYIGYYPIRGKKFWISERPQAFLHSAPKRPAGLSPL